MASRRPFAAAGLRIPALTGASAAISLGGEQAGEQRFHPVHGQCILASRTIQVSGIPPPTRRHRERLTQD